MWCTHLPYLLWVVEEGASEFKAREGLWERFCRQQHKPFPFPVLRLITKKVF